MNSYIVTGEDRNLMVDTGMNRSECIEVLDQGLASLDIDLSKTDVFVTHLHADHLGLAPHVSQGRTSVHMGPADIENINERDYWSRMLSFALKNGFPAVDPQEAIRKHPGFKYGPLGPMNLTPANDGDIIIVGDRRFKVVHTPGHTRGHNCLYEEDEKLLLSGDHILGDITPNISNWDGEEDPLSDYLFSLKLVRELEIDLVLPGHRSLIRDPVRRIDELIEHHRERAHEVLDIMGTGAMNGFSIASRMTWDLSYKSFEEFPIMQKWFALGEALAHIRLLESNERLLKEDREGIVFYRNR